MSRKAVFWAAGLFVALHLLVLLSPWETSGISGLLVFACSVSAVVACYRRSTGSSGPVRRKWDFLASALSLWSIGKTISLFRQFFPSPGHSNALGPEFYYLVYGIPVLLAISASNEERDTVLFVLIDSFQAIFAVGLVYVELSLSQSASTSGVPNLMLIYGIGAWVLAFAALLRLLARPGGEERALYRILFPYLCASAIFATPWHGSNVYAALPIGNYRDLLGDGIFLILTAGCLLVRARPEPERAAIETNSFALVLNNGSPILFTLAVLALGAMVARVHFTLGIAAISLSLVTYCFRATLLQSAYMQAQHALTRSQFALREANARLKQLSLHDGLTGLPNRRQFDQTLDLEWNRALRNRRPLCLLILDLDCFKALNDRYGHQAGDDCLQRVSAALQGCLRRAGEVAARYGGEEFAAILPDSDIYGATAVAEAMLESVHSLQILNEGSAVDRFVTVSIGVAIMEPSQDCSPIQLIASADEALYRAKRNGRNQMEVAEQVSSGD